MITGSEILKELQAIKKKTEFTEITYPNNDIWPKVNASLSNIISSLKNDIKIFGYE